MPLWKLGVTAAALLVTVFASRERRAGMQCPACGATAARPWLVADARISVDNGVGRTRRAVLRVLGTATATAAGGLGVIGGALFRNRGWIPVARDIMFAKVEATAKRVQPEWQEARVKTYRRLGRTNVMVSDISLGSARIDQVAVAQRALDRGINYFDTAPDYSQFGSELVLGQALKGRRHDAFVATKFCVSDGHLPNDTPVPKIIETVEGSLKRLQTDYVDLVHIHSCDSVDRLMAPNIHEAFDRLKEQGKARFLGVSTHTPNLEEVANTAIDSGRFDVMMLAYNFGLFPKFGHLLAKAHEHDVGVVAMKTLKGAKHTNLAEFRKESASYAQAAFRWVLSNPHVSCLVISFYELPQVDEYLYASGMAPQSGDLALLQRYDQLIAGDYCQPHCGECLSSCPYDLPINDILRYRMYAKDYGWEKEGRRHYAKLSANASACASCSAPCTNTCPIGVPIRDKMLDSHQLLAIG